MRSVFFLLTLQLFGCEAEPARTPMESAAQALIALAEGRASVLLSDRIGEEDRAQIQRLGLTAPRPVELSWDAGRWRGLGIGERGEWVVPLYLELEGVGEREAIRWHLSALSTASAEDLLQQLLDPHR
ncbi:MAG: hypothetical protein VYD19_02565, partial [Myxococcota bacterium]|nr:hypothetical protein [Myxococcota bacterium]